MRTILDRSVQELGDGTVVLLDSGETVFKLDSFKGNPINKASGYWINLARGRRVENRGCL